MADREDPHLALLAWRNTPAEQLGLSPNQVLFGRRIRTHLPTTDAFMSGTYDGTAREALSAAKQRQAAYYDRRARVRPTLAVGDTVRTRWNNNDEWEKAEVTRVLPHLSYLLRFENDSTRRRTSKHVRFSNEPPLITRDEIDGRSAATQPLPQPPPRGEARISSLRVLKGVLPPSPPSLLLPPPAKGVRGVTPGKFMKFYMRFRAFWCILRAYR
jgi:hypothetical protein